MALQVYGAPLVAGTTPFMRTRRTGLGGSDAGAVLGVSPWQSALGLWEEKRGLAPERSEPTEVMTWGTRLEHAVRRGYVEDTGIAVTKPRETLRHPELPWLMGHIDGWTDREHPRARLLEVKTAQRLDEQWGEPGSADVPMHYFCQVQHYMAVTGYQLADLAVLVQGRRMDIYTVPRDQAFIDALIADETTFWQRVVQGVPPNPDGSESAGAALRRMFPLAVVDEVVGTPEMQVAATDYLVAQGNRDEWQRTMDVAAQRMQAHMGAHARMLVPGATVSWTNRAGSQQWKPTAAAYRDLLVPHYSDDELDAVQQRYVGEPTRTFRVTRREQRS